MFGYLSIFLKKGNLYSDGKSVRFVVGGPGVHSLCRVIPKKLLKMVFTASLLGAQHKKKDSVENKPASLLVVS